MTKRDSVAEVLRREILSGRLRPGTQLRQQALADRLGVSATPVREAFRLLEAEGYVEARAHHGVVVNKRKYDDMIDAYELRLSIEAIAIGRIARSGDLQLLEQLRKATAAGERARKAGDTQAFRRASLRFHETLVAAAKSSLLVQINDRLMAHWFSFPHDPERMTRASHDHQALIDRLERHDADGALAVLRRHLDSNIEVLKKLRDQTDSDAATADTVQRTSRVAATG